ncbi:Uncharacterised protein [Mycobacteroides abscessus subsp. abscessus]|nr:Uncharacterised protein [Mycobacteroides abscessus subsp. abscessus]
MEPAVFERLCRGFRVVPVTVEDHAAAQQHLAVLADANGVARHGLSDGPDLDLTRGVHAEGRGGLGQSVSLVDGDTDSVEEVPEHCTERRAAGDGELALPTERRAQLAVHEAVEDGVLHLEQ